MARYPAEIAVVPPERFERIQLLLRVALVLAVGYIGLSLGWLMVALYLILPVIAGIVISQRGSERFHAEVGPHLARVLRWIVAFYAYMMLLTDRFPAGETYAPLEVRIESTGRPTLGAALARLITSLPLALILMVLGFIAGFVWLLSAIWVLVDERYPAAFYRYQRGLLRWEARFLAYHSSLVEEYPPISFDTGRGEPVGAERLDAWEDAAAPPAHGTPEAS